MRLQYTSKHRLYPIFSGYFHCGKGTTFLLETLQGKKRLKTKKIGLNRNDSSRYLAAGEGFELWMMRKLEQI